MKALFLVAIVIVGCFAVEEGQEVITKLESTAFGKQILNTIQLQMQSGDPADDLIHMLQEQEDQLEAQQSADDEAIMALENQCVTDLAKYVEEIEQTRTKIQELNDLLDDLRPLKAEKESQKADLEEFRDLLVAKLAQLEAAKVRKDAEWHQEAEDHDHLTSVVNQGRTIIQNNLVANSFLQTSASAKKTILTQLSSHFGEAKKAHYKQKSINSIFRILAQVCNSAPVQADQEIIDKILDLIQNLLDKIAESRALEKRDYDHWVSEYTKTKVNLNGKLDKTNAQIAQLTIEINQLTKRINLAVSELHEQEVRLSQKIAQHDERETYCNEAGTKYAHDREARDGQREIVSDAIGLLMAKIRLLKRYVSERVANLDKPFP